MSNPGGIKKQMTGTGQQYNDMVEDQLKEMVEDQKKFIDRDRKDSDSDDENSSDDGSKAFIFESAIDVGSHFVDVAPSDELLFSKMQDQTNPQLHHFTSQLTLNNPCSNAPIAFFVYTSSNIPFEIVPHQGFIPQQFQQQVKISWRQEHAQNPVDPERLESAMFFIKALPLNPNPNVAENTIEHMTDNLNKVFNQYNINILFTTHHLPCRAHEDKFDPRQMQQMQARAAKQKAGGAAAAGGQPQQAMTKELWESMTPEQQNAYRQKMAGGQQQQQQQTQQPMTQERWASMTPDQQNQYKQQMQQMQQQQAQPQIQS